MVNLPGNFPQKDEATSCRTNHCRDCVRETNLNTCSPGDRLCLRERKIIPKTISNHVIIEALRRLFGIFHKFINKDGQNEAEAIVFRGEIKDHELGEGNRQFMTITQAPIKTASGDEIMISVTIIVDAVRVVLTKGLNHE